MAARVQAVEVNTPDEIDAVISSWIIQGYLVANRTRTSATLVKKKHFNTMWAVIGGLLCIVPLLVYLLVYAADADRVVEIRSKSLVPAMLEPPALAGDESNAGSAIMQLEQIRAQESGYDGTE